MRMDSEMTMWTDLKPEREAIAKALRAFASASQRHREQDSVVSHAALLDALVEANRALNQLRLRTHKGTPSDPGGGREVWFRARDQFEAIYTTKLKTIRANANAWEKETP